MIKPGDMFVQHKFDVERYVHGLPQPNDIMVVIATRTESIVIDSSSHTVTLLSSENQAIIKLTEKELTSHHMKVDENFKHRGNLEMQIDGSVL